MKKLILTLIVMSCFIGNAQTGISWSASADVASSIYGNNFPRVVMDGSGNPMVSWGSGNEMMFATWNGSSFNTPDTISPNGMVIANANWMGPDIASHGDTIYAIYKETPENLNTSGVWCRSSFDGGATFSAPVLVNAFTADSLTRFPTIAADDNGHPIAAFMEFDPGFGDARWVVAKSTDYGASFASDVKASGWSSGTSEVCDCCPGMITVSGNNVAVLYRDNDSDLRDSWVGLSTDGGVTFTSGMDVDQNGWVLNSCPSSGTDGFYLGDSLYATFMNGASGDYEVFYSRSHHPSSSGGAGIPLNPILPGAFQNYPRLSNSGAMTAFVWRESLSGSTRLLLKYSTDITNGLPTEIDTVAGNYVVSCDVTMSSTQVVVVWQDFNSGTVKYRMGTFPGVGSEEYGELDVQVFPNPASEIWSIKGEGLSEITDYSIVNISGEVVATGSNSNQQIMEISCVEFAPGIYFLQTANARIKLIRS